MKKVIINKKETQNGITLIALVITIIVLLILAGVSIAMLTGQNGILTQAQSAKTTTENKSAEEKVKLAVMGARADDGTLTVGKLRTELANYGGTVGGDAFPVTATVDGKSFTVDDKGNVTSTGSSDETPIENDTLGTVTGSEEKNTKVKDSLGNQVVVPAGFKVVNPNDNVTDGIVVEDISHSATAGSQFVWIPVGDVIKDSVGNKETITLSRYTFADDSEGTPTIKGEEEISDGYGGNYTENTSTNYNSSYGNTIAKDIENFKNKAITNHGYYIGRYEARKNGIQLTVKENDMIYDYIAQPEAATLSREMYSDSNFESDLMNSYAWDTAVYFLQTFDNRANKASLKPYSRQTSLIDNIEWKGTSSLEDTSKQDIICNVWDMASNCFEWTTETASNIDGPGTFRGGFMYSNGYTSYRFFINTSNTESGFSFRPIIYM